MNVPDFDYLIVGSGLFGATFAHFAKRDGKKCLVIDKRPHLGGNVYCEEIEGIHVHKFGPHIFHTDNKETWDFVNSFVPFNHYRNCPVANYHGKLYNLPFNMNTFYQMWGVITPAEAIAKIEEQKADAKWSMEVSGGNQPRNLEEQVLLQVGKDIYEVLVKGYSEKQWGRPCSELPASIIQRIPVRFVFDNNYFDDAYQGIPKGGYNLLIDGLLKGVECLTDVDFFSDRAFWMSRARKVLFTGAIDAFYDYRFGKLAWRTVRMETETIGQANFQGNAVVNYTDWAVPFTRIIEHKHFEVFGQAVYHNPHTVITREYSMEWTPGMEPFYTVNDERNSQLYARYRGLADQEERILFGGRLAEYQYYDMDTVIERAKALYQKQQNLD